MVQLKQYSSLDMYNLAHSDILYVISQINSTELLIYYRTKYCNPNFYSDTLRGLTLNLTLAKTNFIYLNYTLFPDIRC